MDDGGGGSSSGGSGGGDKRILYRLANTFHSEIAHSLPFLPNLPAAFGAERPGISLFESDAARAARDVAIMSKAGKISELLATTDVSYISLKDKASSQSTFLPQPGSLAAAVLDLRRDAFDCQSSGEPRPTSNTQVAEVPAPSVEAETVARRESRPAEEHVHVRAKKPRLKRKAQNEGEEQAGKPEVTGAADITSVLCELLNEYLDRGDAEADPDGEDEGPILSLQDIRSIAEEVAMLHGKAALNKVPVMQLLRLLDLLDRHILQAHLKDIDDNDDMESENFETVMTALESAHITLMIMSSPKMPKQIYKEEHIDRLIEFTRYQIVHSVFTAYDPLYRQIHKNPAADDDEGDDEEEEETGKKSRRRSRGKSKKMPSKVSNAVSNVVHKLGILLGLLKDLLSAERLVDSTILQLMKTVLAIFAVDNIQLLQLKAIRVACAVFSLYPQHQPLIIEEILTMFWKLPSSKRCVRTYLLPDEEPRQIQMLTALLLHLVQCSVSLPKYTSGDSEQDKSALDGKRAFQGAVIICKQFWSSVLQRWASPKTQDGSDAKAIVENILQDLLNTLNVPEFPASSLFLQLISMMLLDTYGMRSKDVAVRVNTIDLLGQIAACLKREAVIHSQDKLWILRELRETSKENAVSKDSCTVCGSSKKNKFTLRCDGCKGWFHGDCVGVTGQDLLGRGWLCECCLCKKQLASFTASSKDKYPKTLGVFKVPRAGVAVVQQILLNFLHETGKGDILSSLARRFYLCFWYRDDPQGIASLPFHHWRSESSLPTHDFGVAPTTPFRDSIVRITRALEQQKALTRYFGRILERLLATLQESAPNPRAKALKAVSGIVEVDPGVLADEKVQSAVQGRFLDTAISVREAAMELVGRHIVSRPDVAIKYFDRLSERLMDTGVSVRKRVIRIIRDFCLSKAYFPKATEACIRVISRINDDEASIQDLVCKTFYEMWFEEQPGQQAPPNVDGSAVPADVAERAQQLVSVLKSLSNHQSVVLIIKRSLALDFIPQTSKSAPPSIISQAAVRNRCELMCTYLMECILKADEASEDSEAQALPYVLALHAFCSVDPTLCAPSADPSRFAVTLQPYLKSQADNRQTSQLLQSIVSVIDTVLPLLRRPPQSFVEELEHDLRQLILRYTFMQVVSASVKCLCSLANICSQGLAGFAFLVRLFYKNLDQPLDKAATLRALYCIGLFVRYGADHIDDMKDPDVTMEKILALYKQNLRGEDPDFKSRALQAVGYIFLARPQYLLEEDIKTITADSLATRSGVFMKVQTLKNFHSYLLEVEKQMGADELGEKDSSNAVPIAAGAGDSNICGGIIQLHWERILERCLDTDDNVRQAALKVVDVVLRQGLVHPLTCVPHLIALEVDQLENNWKLAHRLLAHMNEKYPSFFESRLGDGLQMSFQFIQSGAANSRNQNSQKEATFARGGISRVYKLIRAGRNSRNKFMASVVRKYDWIASGPSSMAFLMYCTEILTSLPFTLADEPLYLIYAINRVLQVRAGDLEASLKAELTQEPLANHIKDCNTADSLAIDIPEDVMLKLQAQSDSAVGLSLLLRLKRHLKVSFALDDARCQAYQPSEAMKNGETVSRVGVKEFNCEDILLERPQSIVQIIQRYQLFKSLLKDDTMDYASYAPPASTKKRSRPSGADGLYQGHGHAGGRMRRKSAPAATEDGSDNDNEGDGDGDEDYGGAKRRKSSTPASRVRSRRLAI